ncbi:MAG: hypothetical protein ABIH66_12770 [bacterium]
MMKSGKTLLLLTIIVCLSFFAVAKPQIAGAIDVKTKSLEGTENADGLTDKQLAIQRWFAYLTHLNPGGEEGWEGWYHDKAQLGLDSYRYSLAFMGYAAGAMAYKTPAYTEVSAKILDDSIRKMIEKRVWDFIKVYWKDEPTFPDPVVWENIMYSGHLMQLIALYESITGDMKYSTEGWDFVWDDKTVIHYTAEKLMQVVYDQVDQDERGGVPCEPDSIFVICNDHPHNAFVLYDAIHGTNFTALDEKWRGWMEKEAPLPRVKGKDYLKISYLRDKETWTTGFGVPGSDGWALAWMYQWTANPKFVCDGWKVMRDNKLWKKAKTGGAYLKATSFAQMFGVDDASGTSFYPIVEAQCHKEGVSRNNDVYAYYENQYGAFVDLDGDGLNESYYYDAEHKNRLWVTANLVTAMVTKGDSLREMYRKPFFKERDGEPFLAHADYPNVWVKMAEFSKKENKLSFTVVKGSAKLDGETELICGNIRNVKSITRNGATLDNYKLESGELRITTGVDGETNFVVSM